MSAVLPLLRDFGDEPDAAVGGLLEAIVRGVPLSSAARTLVRRAAGERADPGVQRLLPLVADVADLSDFDDATRHAMAAARRRRELHFAVLQGVAAMVTQDFRAHGIEPLFLKGFPLALACYARPAHRPMGDLDVAVRPACFAQAEARLLALGFERRVQPDRPSTSRPGEGRAHATTFVHPRHRQVVDLHYHVLSASLWPGADDGFWQEARPLAGCEGALTLAPEHHVVQACLHGYSRSLGLLSIRWMLDVHAVLAASAGAFRWDLVEAEARRHRCGPLLAAALGHVTAQLGLAVPVDALRRLADGPMHGFDRAYFVLSRDALREPSLCHRALLHWRAFQRSRGRAMPSPLAFLALLHEKWGQPSVAGSLRHAWRRRQEWPVNQAKRRASARHEAP